MPFLKAANSVVAAAVIKGHMGRLLKEKATTAAAANSTRGFSVASKVKEKNSRRFWPAELFSAPKRAVPPGRSTKAPSPSIEDRRRAGKSSVDHNECGHALTGSKCNALRVARRGEELIVDARMSRSLSKRTPPRNALVVRTPMVRLVGGGRNGALHRRRRALRRLEENPADENGRSSRDALLGGESRADTSPPRGKTAGQMAAYLRALKATNRTGPAAGASPATAAAVIDPRMFDKTFQGYEETGKWKRALGLLGRLTIDPSSGMRQGLSTYKHVVLTCVKAGRWREATELVLREMPVKGVTPDSVMFCAVMDACGRSGRWREAVACLDGMQSAGITPTVATYNNAITHCGSSGRSQVAVELLERMLKAGVAPNVATYNSVMTACDHVGKWQQTLDLLRSMEATSPRMKPNAQSYNIAMKAVGDAGRCDAALALFRKMPAAGLAPNLDSYVCVARAFSQAGRIEDPAVASLLEEMLQITTTTDAVDSITINGTILSVSSTAGVSGGSGHASKIWKQAVGLLRDIEGRMTLRPAGLATEMERSAQAGSHARPLANKFSGRGNDDEEVANRSGGIYALQQGALSRLSDMSGSEVPQTVGSYSLAITKSAHAGKWEEAVGLLREMSNVGLPPSRKCYHAAIAACGHSREYKEALRLLRELPTAGFPLTDKSYRCAISACGNAGEWEECVSLLREARDAGLPPSPGSYSLVIMALGDGGQWEKALALLKEAESLDIVANGACYNAAVKACKDCGQLQEAAAVSERAKYRTIS